jgi:hypothetical protein
MGGFFNACPYLTGNSKFLISSGLRQVLSTQIFIMAGFFKFNKMPWPGKTFKKIILKNSIF